MSNTKEVVDVFIENHGSIFLFCPATDAGSEWLTENTDGMWMGDALVVEHRYALELAQGLLDAGLEVQ